MTIDKYLRRNSSNDTFDSLYDVPTGMIVLLSFLYGSISVLAVVGNFLVMWVVATSRRMQSVTNCYIANLALADIVIGLFAVPFQFQAALLQRWLLPHFMCAFCPFVQALSVNVSVFTLTAIAVDRHRAIITPLSAHTSKRIAKVIIVFIWMLALSLAAPMAMSWEIIMVEEQDPVTRLFYEKPFCAPSEFGSNSLAIYRLLLYIFQEKFKKEFKQRFTFGQKRNRLSNDSYEVSEIRLRMVSPTEQEYYRFVPQTIEASL
ncbi:unnamed protein product [Leptidea sinapis]|uniref:G-protein coupled receptors family 1 profile domain-containing protein n=1 Tax=Leptidea sinapis TaxID=189913 RepID=A0A5E4QQ85_9NEOP|nr:unnamed protein product [Leptidea sinapis]